MDGMSIWMRMPGQSWPGAEASFVLMWAGMMVPMMLPSFLLLLWPLCRSPWRAAQLAAGYFTVWTAIGALLFPPGAVVAEAAMRWPDVVPCVSGIVVLAAGALQFTAWKKRHLDCLRTVPSGSGRAWLRGLRLGLHCSCGCAGWTAVLLALGMMDLRAMAAVTIGMTAERLLPSVRVATGAAMIVLGLSGI